MFAICTSIRISVIPKSEILGYGTTPILICSEENLDQYYDPWIEVPV